MAARVGRLDEQADAVLALEPDVVALQEVTRTTTARWTERLTAAGLHPLAGPVPADGRRLGVVLAARTPPTPAGAPPIPWPERAVAMTVELDGRPVRVLNLHSPISQRPGRVKVRTLRAAHAWLADGDEPTVLLGDLNTPRREHVDGSAWSFARTSGGALRPERGEDWEAAELGVMVQRLGAHGYVDAFRAVHGYGRKEVSWAWAHGGGWRLDHCLVRGARDVRLCEYVHEVRRAGLSDHSALVADVAF
ncbi:MAG TPA: endonuclease/exonuclease/phosphatase family protein [Solirubrobacteraceae bacterium]|nr:endonuclease/exonuclease/phosphatase family protein [Solirubrobacteraceae bacterium]